MLANFARAHENFEYKKYVEVDKWEYSCGSSNSFVMSHG